MFNLQAAWTDEEREQYKKKYGKEDNAIADVSKEISLPLFSEETIAYFSRVYGKDALKRLQYIETEFKNLYDTSLYVKLSTINTLVNRIHFRSDNEHWKEEDHWALPLEVIGTNYGDTEDMALLKYVLYIKIGLNSKDIYFIKKNLPFVIKNKKYEENISLFYFPKNSINPLVLDYVFKGEEIYKYDNQFEYSYIKISPNKHWNIIFEKNLNERSLDNIMGQVQTGESIPSKERIDIFY